MLVEMWQTILINLEDYRTGTAVSSIDYAEAFNRMSYQECLGALACKGASRLTGLGPGRGQSWEAASKDQSWGLFIQRHYGRPRGRMS